MENKTEKEKWVKIAESQSSLPPISQLADEPLLAGLWCLYNSKKTLGEDHLTYDQMVTILRDYLDFPITSTQIKKAFARAGKRVIWSERGLKISQPGEEYLEKQKTGKPLNVYYLQPNRPTRAANTLDELVKSIPAGELLICDKYYGLNTFEVLESFAQKHKKIKFLTAQMGNGEKQTLVTRELKAFKKRLGAKVEIRIGVAAELHDRYVIAKDRLLLIGHGLKDLGTKESLIVVVGDTFGKDIRVTMTKTFKQRWASGSQL